ncbi:MAG TPA: LysE family translocator [Bryobacteraceae bacterium]|nr:LysE family translocator [Bryobacteraceae bacterium]
MPTLSDFLTFAVATLILNLTPGPDLLYIVARSLGQGRKAGVVSSLGIGTGCLFHTFLAAFGVSAMLRSSPVAFTVIRYAGGAYLIYLGVRLLLRRGEAKSALQPRPPASSAAIFRQGMFTNMLNPKVALFFLAFLPQFVSPHHGPVATQMTVLGLYFIFSGTLVCLSVALLAGAAGDFFRHGRNAARLERASGLVFVALGLRVSLSRA